MFILSISAVANKLRPPEGSNPAHTQLVDCVSNQAKRDNDASQSLRDSSAFCKDGTQTKTSKTQTCAIFSPGNLTLLTSESNAFPDDGEECAETAEG